jgi:peptidyl-prolyl cis-trans isomerase C
MLKVIVMNLSMKKSIAVLFAGLALSGFAYAEEKSKLPSGAAAVVNGVTISDKTLDKIVKANVAQGQKESPELRKVILDELVARELFIQAANKQGLDKTPEVQERLAQLRQDLLIAALEGDYLKKHPITDSDLKAEYDRQINLIGDSQEYNLKQIIVANEADSKAIISALKRGESFEKLAKEKSLDPSKEQGGNLGWVLAKQIIPEIANVLANMSRGSLTAAPIQTSLGWHVIKLEDSRQFKAPTFEESKVRVQQTLMQAKRIELLGKLREAAKIVK